MDDFTYYDDDKSENEVEVCLADSFSMGTAKIDRFLLNTKCIYQQVRKEKNLEPAIDQMYSLETHSPNGVLEIIDSSGDKSTECISVVETFSKPLKAMTSFALKMQVKYLII